METPYLLVQLFERGGLIMWPLLLTSTLALMVVLERGWFWWQSRRQQDATTVKDALELVEKGHIEQALTRLADSRDFVARMLHHGLVHRHGSLEGALQMSASAELTRMSRFLPVLDTIVTLAPLLGLLGTVFGIMHSFQMMGDAELTEPKAVTGGIAEALIATGFGLAIAIMSLIPLNFFNTRVQHAKALMENYGTYLEVLHSGKRAAPSTQKAMRQPAPSEEAALI